VTFTAQADADLPHRQWRETGRIVVVVAASYVGLIAFVVR
jgi:hypothetical protein